MLHHIHESRNLEPNLVMNLNTTCENSQIGSLYCTFNIFNINIIADVKIVNLPKFHGTLGENWQNWKYLISNYLKAENVPQLEVICRILPLKRGHVLGVVIKFQKDNENLKDNWGEVLNQLDIIRYNPTFY